MMWFDQSCCRRKNGHLDILHFSAVIKRLDVEKRTSVEENSRGINWGNDSNPGSDYWFSIAEVLKAEMKSQ